MNEATTEDFIDVSPDHNGGILKKIVFEGEGKNPTIGCEVDVRIKCLSRPIEEEVETTKCNLGKGEIVKGCEIGIETMKIGEKAIFRCAPQFINVYPSVSETSTLDFELELINWQYEDISPTKDGGIRRKILIHGAGNETPNEGAEATIHLVGKYNGKVFEERKNVSFSLGEGEEFNIVQGIDLGLENFKKGESSRLFLKPKYAFSDEGSIKFGIPPNADVEYEVTLECFIRRKDIWLMDDDEKIRESSQWKEKGNSYFKQGKLQLAMKMYKRVIEMLKIYDDGRYIKEEDPESESTFFSAHMNLCLCCLKTENYLDAKHSVNVAIALRPNDEKAHFRLGKVLYALGEYRSAIDSFQECLEINPDNKAAFKEIKLCSHAIKEHMKQEKKIYGQMFDKFAETDSIREQSEMRKICNVMSSVGEWGAEDREREPSEFEKENPDIILLNKTGEFKDM